MAYDSGFLRQLLEETQEIEMRNPRELLIGAVSLLYARDTAPAPSTPPLVSTPPLDYTMLQEEGDDPSTSEDSEDRITLDILHQAWVYLEQAAEEAEQYPLHRAAALREQALLIFRLVHNLSITYPIGLPVILNMRAIIGTNRCHSMYAENLMLQAAKLGDTCAQIFSVRRLLELVEPANKSMATTKRIGFEAWLNTHSDYKRCLSLFSKGFLHCLGEQAEKFLECREQLITRFRCDTLVEFMNHPSQKNTIEFLVSSMRQIVEIDLAFRANWNEVRRIPTATREKLAYKGLLFSDRTNSQPTKKIRKEKKRQLSDPAIPKADPDGNRTKNPAQYIQHKPKQAKTNEDSDQTKRTLVRK